MRRQRVPVCRRSWKCTPARPASARADRQYFWKLLRRSGAPFGRACQIVCVGAVVRAWGRRLGREHAMTVTDDRPGDGEGWGPPGRLTGRQLREQLADEGWLGRQDALLAVVVTAGRPHLWDEPGRRRPVEG